MGQVESTRQLVARGVAREEMKRRARAPPDPLHLFREVRHGKRKEKTVAGVRIRENFDHVTRVRPSNGTRFLGPCCSTSNVNDRLNSGQLDSIPYH